MIFTLSFKTGTIPLEWKHALVVPVHKKGDKSNVENYRPISLTCLSMKIFEYIIRDILINKCEHLLDPRQHGFLRNKSCTTQMIPFSNKLAFTLNKSSRTDVIYFDFAKAFDSVSHDMILHKLKHQFGIDGLLLKFMKSYLENRTQQVAVDGSKSLPLDVLSGVPQGSVLGPLLFVIFINDMQSQISDGTQIALYADDTKIWREICSDADQDQLQRDIDALYRWSVDNRMRFHPDKCKVLVVTLKHVRNELPFDRYGYHLNNTYLDYVSREKDLGVITREDLSWSNHCVDLVSKANQRLGLVRRTCHFTKDRNQRRVLYLALVRSIFEHCSVVWKPHTTTHLESFDKLQKRAVKWILNEPLSSYSDTVFVTKQFELDLLPMRSKFLFTDLVLFHKIVYNLVNINFPDYIIQLNPSLVTRTRQYASVSDGDDLLKFRCTARNRINAFSHSFFPRNVEEWNSIPLHIRQIPDPKDFYIELKKFIWSNLGFSLD